MKNTRKNSMLALSALVMAMNAGAAFSGTSYSYAAIDWSTFNIETYGLGGDDAPMYKLKGGDSTTTSSVSDWVNWSSDVANNPYSFSASVEGEGEGSGSGSVYRNALIHVKGDGVLVFSADYELGAGINGINLGGYDCEDGDCTYNPPNSADASLSFDLFTQNDNNGSSTYHAENSIFLGGFFGTVLTEDEKFGTLQLGILVHDGDQLDFSAMVSANANDNGMNPDTNLTTPTTVPLPTAVWLFGTALLGYLGLGRRKAFI